MLEILLNTRESHKAVAEAVQPIWKRNLNIEAGLVNQECNVYMDSARRLDYHISRFGWIGDDSDPNTFLDLFIAGGGNNHFGGISGYPGGRTDRIMMRIAEFSRLGRSASDDFMGRADQGRRRPH